MSSVAVPDSLLAPLLEVAAEVLHGLGPDEVPVALRPLAGFDRRGLANATARHQLRRTFDLDGAFRSRVADVFGPRPEVADALGEWSSERAVAAAIAAAERDDLGLLASALYCARPDGYEFGLGVVCGEDQQRRDARARHDEARAREAQLGSAEEARRRAEDGLAALRAEAARIEGELREERRSRREREADADRRAEESERRARAADAALDKARRDAELAETRVRREAERAREAERRLRELGREAPAPPTPPRPSGRDVGALRDLAGRARDLASALEQLATPPPPSAPSPANAPPAASPRRTPVPCPPGLRADQPEGLEAMLRTRGVVVVVDGYNVSMEGWPGSSPLQQRDHLVGALGRLHLRVRCDVLVVFDGSDVVGVAPRRTPGVRVLFSAAEEQADPMIVREVAAMPSRVPVLVVSSDRWVQDHAALEGATPVSASVLLDVVRR